MLKKKIKPCTTQKLGMIKGLLLSFASWMATGAIASSPAVGATFAISESLFDFGNFSHKPHSTETFAGTDTLTIAESGGSVAAIGQADAFFFNFPLEAFGGDFSSSLAFGEGHDYIGLAQSKTRVVGDFIIDKDESFYFDFAGFLNLATALDSSPAESSLATGNIFLGLFDSTNLENITLLEYMSLFGYLETAADTDAIGYGNSDAVTADYWVAADFSPTEEFAMLSVNGSLQRHFENPTHLTLVEIKTNGVAVKAPEPALTIGLFLFAISLACKSGSIKSKKGESVQN